MAKSSRWAAFILPFVLIVSAALLMLGTFIVQQGLFAHHLERTRSVHKRCRDTIRHQVPLIVEQLESMVLQRGLTTALVEKAIGNVRYPTTVIPGDNGKPDVSLSSWVENEGARTVVFKSPSSETHLVTKWQIISPAEELIGLEYAWVAEDISLNPKLDSPPSWWPLSSWFLYPGATEPDLGEVFLELAGEYWSSEDWIPKREPLPFRAASSPAFVPVVTSVGLRHGVFASGVIGSREKIVRIRFYLECTIWNPYNKPIQIHQHGGKSPAFQIVFWNLPEIRIRNLSTGTATNWTKMDNLVNSSSGSVGFHGWISTLPVLAPGQHIRLLEPDEGNQAEGLARTLHPSFMVGPADEIIVEYRPHTEGLSVSCLELGTANPLEAAKDGKGWFRIEGFQTGVQKLHFDRADDYPRPFYLSAGSLSFRIENTHQQILLHREEADLIGMYDPRMRVIKYGVEERDSADQIVKHSEIIQLHIPNLRKSAAMAPAPENIPAIFSWPSSNPDSLIMATDLPAWRNAFRVGSEGASSVNDIVGKHWPNVSVKPLHKEMNGGLNISFHQSLPVNSQNLNAWLTAFNGSLIGGSKFALYPHPVREVDYMVTTVERLRENTSTLLKRIRLQPSYSVNDFFTRGILADTFLTDDVDNSLNSLLPLRGWLRNSPQLVAHGGSWIIHIAIRAKLGSLIVTKSARAWLLALRNGEERLRFTLIRLEWTDPGGHLIPSLN